MGILVTYAQQVTLSRDHINNTLRGIGVMEDADTVLLDSNVYTNNHEDGEHFGESYLPGDAVTNVSSQYALLNGYSDDGIAVVGGNLACTTNLSAPGGPVSNVTIVHPTIVGSQNPGGSGIYNCAIQIAGNAKNVSVIGASITQPGACSFQIVDFFGAAPHHVTIAGGHAEYGRTWGAAPILISGEGGPTNRFWPGCSVAPITDVLRRARDHTRRRPRSLAPLERDRSRAGASPGDRCDHRTRRGTARSRSAGSRHRGGSRSRSDGRSR